MNVEDAQAMHTEAIAAFKAARKKFRAAASLFAASPSVKAWGDFEDEMYEVQAASNKVNYTREVLLTAQSRA
ncbi:MAG TPA: hypothetical protein VNM48_06480 [Chloroflexota bacterium]|nr:hypothetical protein [Chloroflexota bacterium]